MAGTPWYKQGLAGLEYSPHGSLHRAGRHAGDKHDAYLLASFLAVLPGTRERRKSSPRLPPQHVMRFRHW